jgi:hypothetical protein
MNLNELLFQTTWTSQWDGEHRDRHHVFITFQTSLKLSAWINGAPECILLNIMILSFQSCPRLFGKFSPQLPTSPSLKFILLQSNANLPTSQFSPWQQQVRTFRAEPSHAVPTGASALRDAPVRDHYNARHQTRRPGQQQGGGDQNRFRGRREGQAGQFGHQNQKKESDDKWYDLMMLLCLCLFLSVSFFAFVWVCSWICASLTRRSDLDESEGDASETVKKDPWEVGPFNEGLPSLQYECIPGADLKYANRSCWFIWCNSQTSFSENGEGCNWGNY